jgi:uncharacterized protein (DUF4415 family)
MHVKGSPMVHVNVRVTKDVLDFFKAQPHYTQVMREALEQYVKAHQKKPPIT